MTRRYQARSRLLTLAGGTIVAAAWDALDSHEGDDIVRLRDEALPQVMIVAQRAAALSAAYLGLLIGAAVATTPTIVEPDWAGPFIRQWAALGADKDIEAALIAGHAQADAVGRNSVVSTGRRVGDLVDSDQVTGWRRVTSIDPCEWCIQVSGRIYKTAESADFGHDRCSCSVAPVLR